MALDRAGIEAAPPQHAGNRASQQAGSYRLGRARPWSRISADDHASHGLALTNRGSLHIFPAGLRDGMKRWMNGLPGAAKRLGAMMAR